MDIQSYNEQFQKVVNIIESAKERAYRKVNEELILMYRDIGEYISKQSYNSAYGDAFVQKLADFFAENYPELKGFDFVNNTWHNFEKIESWTWIKSQAAFLNEL